MAVTERGTCQINLRATTQVMSAQKGILRCYTAFCICVKETDNFGSYHFRMTEKN